MQTHVCRDIFPVRHLSVRLCCYYYHRCPASVSSCREVSFGSNAGLGKYKVDTENYILKTSVIVSDAQY